MSTSSIPLKSLFGKSEAAMVKVSPGGKWLAWLARTNGILNIWIASLPLNDFDEMDVMEISGAKQVTAATDRDICFTYRFTCDDKVW